MIYLFCFQSVHKKNTDATNISVALIPPSGITIKSLNTSCDQILTEALNVIKNTENIKNNDASVFSFLSILKAT